MNPNQRAVRNVKNPDVGSWDSIIIGLSHIMEALSFDQLTLIQKFEERLKEGSKMTGLIQTQGRELDNSRPPSCGGPGNMMVLASLYMLRIVA